MKYLVPTLALVGLLAGSCASTQSFVYDDAYSVKPSELAVGESPADETSYAAFKARKQGTATDQMTYADQQMMLASQNCRNLERWYSGCGCTQEEWRQVSMYSPLNNRMKMLPSTRFRMYVGTGVFMQRGAFYYGMSSPLMYNSFGVQYPHMYYDFLPNYSTGYYNPYYAYNGGYYGGMPYYGGYYGGNYSPYYSNGYYGGGYYGYGYGGNNNGWGGNNNSGTGNMANNTVKGPRGTQSTGTYNPYGRTSTPDKVKSATAPNGGRTSTTTASARPSNVREVGTREVASGSRVVTDRTSTGTRPVSTTSRPTITAASSTSARPVVDTRSPYRQTSPSVARENGTTITPSRTSETTIAPSRPSTSTYPSRTAAPANNGTMTRDSYPSQRTTTPSTTRSTPSMSSPSMSSPSRSTGGSFGGGSTGGGRSGGSTGSSSSSGPRR